MESAGECSCIPFSQLWRSEYLRCGKPAEFVTFSSVPVLDAGVHVLVSIGLTTHSHMVAGLLLFLKKSEHYISGCLILDVNRVFFS